jgi:osmoprotectant transport system substrate-binding protein
MKKLSSLLLALVMLSGLFAAAPGSLAETNKLGPITIATMIDSEGAVIGSMMVQLLTQAGFQVVDRTEFGTPEILRAALMAGEVDLVLDYTGSGQYYHETESTDAWSDPVKGYELTRDLDLKFNDLVWLTPANANNTEGLAVRRAFAEEHGLKTIQDLADYVNAGGQVKLIAASSFVENVKGLIGFEEAYGFKLKADQLIILASGNTAEMLKALYEQRDGVNVSLVYGTDGSMKVMDLVVLEDPKSIPPVYLPTPVLRGELHRKYPQIEEILKPLFQSLTLETLQALNAQVAFDGRAARDVAREYLAQAGLLTGK